MGSAVDSYVYIKAEQGEAELSSGWISPEEACQGCQRAPRGEHGDLACLLRMLRRRTGRDSWLAFLLDWTEEHVRNLLAIWRSGACKESGWQRKCCRPYEEVAWREIPDVVVLSPKSVKGPGWQPVVAHVSGIAVTLDRLAQVHRTKGRQKLSKLPPEIAEQFTESSLDPIRDAQGDKNTGAYVCVVIVGGTDGADVILGRLAQLHPVIEVLPVVDEADLQRLTPYLSKKVAMRQIWDQHAFGLSLLDHSAGNDGQGRQS